LWSFNPGALERLVGKAAWVTKVMRESLSECRIAVLTGAFVRFKVFQTLFFLMISSSFEAINFLVIRCFPSILKKATSSVHLQTFCQFRISREICLGRIPLRAV